MGLAYIYLYALTPNQPQCTLPGTNNMIMIDNVCIYAYIDLPNHPNVVDVGIVSSKVFAGDRGLDPSWM